MEKGEKIDIDDDDDIDIDIDIDIDVWWWWATRLSVNCLYFNAKMWLYNIYIHTCIYVYVYFFAGDSEADV